MSDQIQMGDLVQEYARLTPLARIKPPSAIPGAFNQFHNMLLNEILLNPHLSAYPPASEYQFKFWKWAIQGLEALVGDEVGLQDSYWVALRD